jgi:type II secretory pathway component PulF
MASFLYKALAANGSMTEGQLDAGGRQEALRQLEERGLRPVRVREQAGPAKPERAASNPGEGVERKRIPARELENFMRQLSSLLAAGVPLSRALQLLSRESSSRAGSAQWKMIHDMVIDGTPLADAMTRLPGTFPRVYVAMVRAGETGGFLDVVLSQIADFQAREKELRGKVTSALIYPAVLMLMAIGVLIFLLTFFIPKFQGIFSGFGAALPLLTRAIIAASNIATHYGFFVALIVGLIVYAVRQWLRSDEGRRAWDDLLLRLPVVGPLASRFAMTRFCRMLGTLVRSGVALITALRVARESLGNQTLVDAVSTSIERVQKGDALAKSLADCPQLFPGSVIEMIAVAEESGRLDQELVRLANVTEQDLDGQLRMAVSLAEPLLLFLMAAFIGTIFVGMVIPIFTIQDYIK